jgi:WD40 repeat protein
VTGSYDSTLRLWRVSDGGLIAELKGHKDKVRSVAVRLSDGMIASGDYSGEIRLWDGADGHFLRTLANQGGIVGVLRFSPDGQRLLSTCALDACGYTPRVWEIATGKELIAFASKHDNIVLGGAISPEGGLAATAGGNAFPIYVWDLVQRV